MPSCAQQPLHGNVHVHREKEDGKLKIKKISLIRAIEYRVSEASRNALFFEL